MLKMLCIVYCTDLFKINSMLFKNLERWECMARGVSAHCCAGRRHDRNWEKDNYSQIMKMFIRWKPVDCPEDIP